MKRWQKIAVISPILALVLFRVSICAIFYYQESSILRDARQVLTPSDVEALVSKYNLVHDADLAADYQYYCYSQPAPYYVHQHYFNWSFNPSGKRNGYFRSSYREKFRMEFTETEVFPSS
jgi:hypothetical protein